MADLSKAPRFGKNWQSLGDVWSVVAASIFFRGIRMLPVIAVIAVFPDFSKHRYCVHCHILIYVVQLCSVPVGEIWIHDY